MIYKEKVGETYSCSLIIDDKCSFIRCERLDFEFYPNLSSAFPVLPRKTCYRTFFGIEF